MINGSILNTDYICFGRGSRNLILLPGLGDGLRTVRGSALPMQLLYHRFTEAYTVYAFSRRNDLTAGASTRDMARDLKACMDALGIGKADIWGVSMGGMIAQWMAVDYPEAVEKLVLTVTCHQPNPILTGAVTEWLELAKANDHAGLMDSNLRLIYSDKYYQKNKKYTHLTGKLMRPASYDRFIIQAEACLQHDAAQYLSQISAKTLVIGGGLDQALGVAASYEIADAIPEAVLKIYPDLGHGLYDEAKDFQSVVLRFLQDGTCL